MESLITLKRTCQLLIYTSSQWYSHMSWPSRSALDLHLFLEKSKRTEAYFYYKKHLFDYTSSYHQRTNKHEAFGDFLFIIKMINKIVSTHSLYIRLLLNLVISYEGAWGMWMMNVLWDTTNLYLNWTTTISELVIL